MKTLTTAIMSLICMAFMVTLNTNAAEKAPAKAAKAETVTLAGKGICGKCNLKEASSCAEVLQVTQADGTVKNYYMKGKASKATKIRRKDVSVSGTVKEVDGKLILVASEITVKE